MTGLSQKREFSRNTAKVTALTAAFKFSIIVNGKQDEHGGAIKLGALLYTID